MSEVDWERLATSACAARARAYAPYSSFQVGAALLSARGDVYVGCNVENVSYGLSVCAERHAVAAARLAGDTCWTALLVATGASQPTPPCGACRQVLAEFASLELRVRCVTAAGLYLDTSLGELLPHAFGRGSLT